MAEFCFECYKKYLDKDAEIENLVMSKDLDLCEGCAQYKRTVIKIKKPSVFNWFIDRFK